MQLPVEYMLLIPILVGLIVISFGLREFSQIRNFLKISARAKGIVFDLKSVGDGCYAPVVRYTDSISGEEYEVTSTTGSKPPEFEVGEEVDVVYNPSNLSEASINTIGELWGKVIFLVCFGSIFIAVGTILLLPSLFS